jgi:uncharacterized protein YjbI with pentapeptide repeats
MNLAGADFSECPAWRAPTFPARTLRGANFSPRPCWRRRNVFTGSEAGEQAIFAGANLGFAQLGRVTRFRGRFSGRADGGRRPVGRGLQRRRSFGLRPHGRQDCRRQFVGRCVPPARRFIQVNLKAAEAPADEDLENANVDIPGHTLAGADLTEAHVPAMPDGRRRL